jgi:hypothetical protein
MKLKGRIIGNKLITPISKVFSKAKKKGVMRSHAWKTSNWKSY